VTRLAAYATAALVLALALPAAAQEGEVRPPFVTTPADVVSRMLRFAGTGPADLVVDLGSGDGRIVIAAVREFGARALGIELDPRLVEKSRENARASFVQGDVLRTDFSQASVVTVYLLPQLINQLQPRFMDQLRPGTRIVSHAFAMTGWKPDQVESMRPVAEHPGQGDSSTYFLWIVPAKARGSWEGGGWRLRISQNFQELEVDAALNGHALRDSSAKLRGSELLWEAPGLKFEGRVEGDRIAGTLTLDGARAPLVLTKSP
jgi:hypothetical protein